jgi:hypothetical protein
MCLREAGNFDSNSGKKADIYISFKISDLEEYGLKIVNDYDLLFEHSIHIYDALSGYTLYYSQHPNKNKYAFKVNEVIKSEDIKICKKLGLPNDDDGHLTFGKFVIKFNYKYPSSILGSDQLKSFLKEHADTKSINKDDYLKEKLISPEADSDDERRNQGQHGRGPRRQPDQDGGVQCAQS